MKAKIKLHWGFNHIFVKRLLQFLLIPKQVIIKSFKNIINDLERYRVQSDSTDFLFILIRELIIRIKKHQPNVKLYSPVPLHLFITGITRYLEVYFFFKSF